MNRRREVMAIASSIVALAGAGCKGNLGGSDSAASGKPAACSANDAMMKSLAPTCSGCHSQGTLPFFASLAAFEDLLAYNPKYVVPGHAEKSYLIALLQGQGSGTYKQMPLAGDAFVKLAAAGKTQVSLQDVEDWIGKLTAKPENPNPDPMAATAQRLSAEQVRATLYAQLGLTQADFLKGPVDYVFGTPTLSSLGDDNYPVYGLDEVDTLMEPEPIERHTSLGGAQSLGGRRRDSASSPPFAQALVPISQRWCKMAIAKANNTLLFPKVDPAAASATAAADIKKNIAYLALHFLGDPAAPEDVDDVFTKVFVPIELASDPPTAWAGVCSYFIRHPKWVFF